MSDEKTKTQQGPSGLQRTPEGSSTQEQADRETVAACERKEAALFAQRGYGGYINTDELAQIRKTKAEAASRINSRR